MSLLDKVVVALINDAFIWVTFLVLGHPSCSRPSFLRSKTGREEWSTGIQLGGDPRRYRGGKGKHAVGNGEKSLNVVRE